jgi:hypothetical protein
VRTCLRTVAGVAPTAAASGQMLRFNGSSWVNEDSPYDVGMFIPGTRHAALDRHRRGRLHDGIACRNRPTSSDVHGRMVVCYRVFP